jgi:glycosyltransferase involved in cell wall biosynthesis
MLLKVLPLATQILPVDSKSSRPQLSVMIPTYNCAELLKVALNSVLTQLDHIDEVQIEVIDDNSTKDDPETVVREYGRGRVTFYRHVENKGATGNFNSCLQRARGRWIHVLHGDDFVLPGFYQTVTQAIEANPRVGIIATRNFVVDERGEINSLSRRTYDLEEVGRNALPYTLYNPFQFAGVVISRDAVEEEGGFNESLVHVADWELWTRLMQRRGALSINKPLASYRVFDGNDTSRLKRTGENLRDYERLAGLFAASIPGFDSEDFLKRNVGLAREQADFFRSQGDLLAAASNEQFWMERVPVQKRLLKKSLNFVRDLKRKAKSITSRTANADLANS